MNHYGELPEDSVCDHSAPLGQIKWPSVQQVVITVICAHFLYHPPLDDVFLSPFLIWILIETNFLTKWWKLELVYLFGFNTKLHSCKWNSFSPPLFFVYEKWKHSDDWNGLRHKYFLHSKTQAMQPVILGVHPTLIKAVTMTTLVIT